MTDRLKGFIVHLEEDMRDDDAQAVIDAIQMIRRVSKVTPLISNIEDHMARERVRMELSQKLFEVLHPTDKSSKR